MAITQETNAYAYEIQWKLGNFSKLTSATRTFYWYCTPKGGSQVLAGTTSRAPGTTTASYTYSGLQPNTEYDLYCRMVVNGNEYTYFDFAMTTEAPPPIESYSMEISPSTTSSQINVLVYNISYSQIYRTIKLYVDDVVVDFVGLSAGSYESTVYLSANVEDGKWYWINIVMEDESGGYLTNTMTQVYTPDDNTANIRTSNVGETNATIEVFGLNGNKSYARILKWYRKGPSDSDYILVSTTQVYANSSNTSYSFSETSLKANRVYEYKVEMLKGETVLTTLTTTVVTNEVAGTLSVNNIGESSVTLTLSGLTNSIGRKIKWYYKKSTETGYTLAGETTMTSNATSTSKVIDALIQSTTYNFKAEIYDATDETTLLGVKTSIATTQKQVAVMRLDAATSVSLRVKLSEMDTAASYDKYIYWYIKRSTDANFVESGYDIVTSDSGTASISHIFTGLVSSTLGADGRVNKANYDIKVVIKKNNTTTMTTMINTYATTLRDSDIPQPAITEVLQIVGEKKAELWWEAPEHVASSEAYVHYDIEISTNGTSFTKHKTVDIPPQDYTEVVFGAFDTKYYVRVKAYPAGSSSDYKVSNIVEITLTEDFDWETVSQGAECIVRADKWNLLIRYIRKRISDKGITSTFEMVRAKPGNQITAYMFNQLVTACNAFYNTGIAIKQPGDAIRASDLLKLQEAANIKEV